MVHLDVAVGQSTKEQAVEVVEWDLLDERTASHHL
jgi:hypothetical protein